MATMKDRKAALSSPAVRIMVASELRNKAIHFFSRRHEDREDLYGGREPVHYTGSRPRYLTTTRAPVPRTPVTHQRHVASANGQLRRHRSLPGTPRSRRILSVNR